MNVIAGLLCMSTVILLSLAGKNSILIMYETYCVNFLFGWEDLFNSDNR